MASLAHVVAHLDACHAAFVAHAYARTPKHARRFFAEQVRAARTIADTPKNVADVLRIARAMSDATTVAHRVAYVEPEAEAAPVTAPEIHADECGDEWPVEPGDFGASEGEPAPMVPQPVQVPQGRAVVPYAGPVVLDLDAAAAWPRPLIEINPRPPVLQDLPPAPCVPFWPVLDVPAPAPRPMGDVLQSIAAEFGPPVTFRRMALALRPEPAGFLDRYSLPQALALYAASIAAGLALVALAAL